MEVPPEKERRDALGGRGTSSYEEGLNTIWVKPERRGEEMGGGKRKKNVCCWDRWTV
jgi:hypothetical protein